MLKFILTTTVRNVSARNGRQIVCSASPEKASHAAIGTAIASIRRMVPFLQADGTLSAHAIMERAVCIGTKQGRDNGAGCSQADDNRLAKIRPMSLCA